MLGSMKKIQVTIIIPETQAIKSLIHCGSRNLSSNCFSDGGG